LPRRAIAGFTSAFGFIFFVCHFCQSPFNFHQVKRISKNRRSSGAKIVSYQLSVLDCRTIYN
jgi:hypothetical protein